MSPRQILIPVLLLGLAGAGVYAVPCFMGGCEDDASIADGEAVDAPCDTPCEPPCDDEKAAVLAAGDEEPCPFAEEARAEAALAAAERDEPCPHALGEQAGEPQLAARVEDQDADGEEAPAVADPVEGEPQT